MISVKHHDNVIPKDLHESVYDYVQTCKWENWYSTWPEPNTNNYKNDLHPYIAQKGHYHYNFNLKNDKPINDLYEYINKELFKNKLQVHDVYLRAEPYETVKETFVPAADCGIKGYQLITFIVNTDWNPVWQGEIVYYDNDDVWNIKHINNVPGRIIIRDSRLACTSKPTSVYASQIAQRINFRVSDVRL
jgi:hypothetical protein